MLIDRMVASMITRARGDAEESLAAAKRALDVAGQHRLAHLRQRCECSLHLVRTLTSFILPFIRSVPCVCMMAMIDDMHRQQQSPSCVY
jgi:hypothetical protein